MQHSKSFWRKWTKWLFDEEPLWNTKLEVYHRNANPSFALVELYDPSRIAVGGFDAPLQIFDSCSGDRLVLVSILTPLLVGMQNTFCFCDWDFGARKTVIKGVEEIYQLRDLEAFSIQSCGDWIVVVTTQSVEMYQGLPAVTHLVWSKRLNCNSVSFSGNKIGVRSVCLEQEC